MLSLQAKPLSGGGRAVNYYFSQDNYYFSGELSTAWHGKGAEKLGLKGEVNQAVLEAFVDGNLPNGEVLGIKTSSGEMKHRGGYDLTFTAPKSMSYLALVGDEKALIDLHKRAVAKALSVAESMAAEARLVKSGSMQYEKTGNLTFATIIHDTSRELDPNLHIHALLMNATECSDGKWRALASDMTRKHGTMEWIMNNKIFLGMVYRSEIAVGVKEMGLGIEKTGDPYGLFEIKGFDQALLTGISKRRTQIKEEVATMKSDTVKAFDRATQNTRKVKVVRDGEELREHWHKESMSYGIDPKTYMSVLQEQERESKPEHEVSDGTYGHQAIQDAISHLSEGNIRMSYQAILEKGLYFSIGECNVEALAHAIEEAIKTKQLIALDKRATEFTTQPLIDAEKKLVETLRASIPQKHGIKRNAALIQGLTDNESIQNVVTEALFHKDSVVRIKQQSSTSREVMKSFLDYADDSKKVRILTPSSLKASSFHGDMNQKPKSLWQWLNAIGKERHAETIKGFNHQHKDEHRLPFFSNKQERELLIVDDAQRVSHADLNTLINIAEKRRAKVILLERPLGLQGFKHDVASLLDKAEVKTFHVKDAIKKTVSVHITEVKDTEDRLKQCANAYTRVPTSERVHTHLVTASNKETQELNHYVRDNLKLQGNISREEATIKTLSAVYLTEAEKKVAKSYKPGLIMYHKSRNGIQKLTIASVIQEDNQLLVQDGDGVQRKLSATHLGSRTAVYDEVPLKVSVGESLLATREMRLEGIKAGSSIEVTSITERGIKIKQGKKTQNLFLDDNRHHPLTYNYAKTLHAHDLTQKKNTILTMPSYALRKNTLSMLTESSKDNVHILTDDADKASHYAKGMRENTTAIDVTLESAKHVFPEKYLSEGVKQSLMTSLHQAIEQLTDEKQPLSEAERALDFAITCLSEEEAAFKATDVLGMALQESIGKTSMDEITTSLDALIKKGDLLCGPNQMLSTKEAVQFEENILEDVRSGKGQVTPLLSKAEAKQKFQDLKLTQGQQDACQLITTTNDRFVMVQGYAGTGKTTMTTSMFEAIKPEENKGIQVISVAPTHQAVKELQAIGIKAQTLKSFLIEQEQTPTVDSNTMVLLDEFSMVGNRDFAQLSSLVHKNKSRCVLLGDISQHQAIEAGKPSPLVMFEGGISVAYMDEIVRQKAAGYKDAVQHLISGNTDEALSALSVLPRNAVQRHEENGFFEQLNSSVVEVVMNEDEGSTQINPRVEGEKIHDLGLLEVAAKDYLSRTPECQKNTIVVIHENKQRDIANQLIREGLVEQKQLGSENKTFHRLVATSHKTQELYHLQSYKGYDQGGRFFLKRDQNYFQIKGIDEASKSVMLLNEQGEETRFLPEKAIRDGRIELFEYRTDNVSVGEKIHFKKTDKSAGRYANERLTVSSVGKDGIKACDASGHEYALNDDGLKNAHWDYSYTATSYAVQGMSAKFVIGVENTRNKYLTHLRGFYISTTRGIQHAMIYTNSIAELKKCISHEPDKTSALEALGRVDLKQAKQRSDKKLSAKKINKVNALSSTPKPKAFTLDAHAISQELSNHAEQVVESLLGESNRALSSKDEYRYGRKGSLAISMQGDSRGTWFNFESQEKGNLIHLIQNTLGLTFKEALAYASNKTGHDLKPTMKPTTTTKKEDQLKPKEAKSQTKAYALQLVKESKPLHGTLAEKYLTKHRGVLNINSADLRFHPSVRSKENGVRSYFPSLLAIARNKDGQVQSVQAIYLDPNTGMKAVRDVDKRTFASNSGSGAIISPGLDKDAVTYLAEGVETALSIRDAVNNERVITVLGKQNFRSIDPALTTQNIVICLDNDGGSIKDEKLIMESVARLEEAGKNVILTRPEQKGDFNDVAMKFGVEGVSKIINNANSKSNTSRIHVNEHAIKHGASSNIKLEMPTEAKEIKANIQNKDLGQIEREIY